MVEDDDAYELALPVGARVEDYEIRKVLGAGGFGITYLAYDHRLHGEVALKEYMPADFATRRSDGRVTARTRSDVADFNWGLERVLDEARILRRLDHPNVVRVIRHFDALDTGFIVMEFVSGRTLEAAVLADGPWDEARLRPVLDGLMSACAKVHEVELLHRDIKPANIMLRPDGRPVLIDFGAARQAITSKSRTVTAMVSPGYGPVEQYSTKAKLGPYTDIYGLAAAAYFALTGEDPVSAVERTRNDPLTPLTRAAKARGEQKFLAAIDAGLKVDAVDRPPDIDSWRGLFPAARVEKGPAPDPIPRRLLILGGAGLGVLAVGGLAIALRPHGAGGAHLPTGVVGLDHPRQTRLEPAKLISDKTDWTWGALWSRCVLVGEDYAVAASRGADSDVRATVQVFGAGGSSDWIGEAGSRAFALASDGASLWVGGQTADQNAFVTALGNAGASGYTALWSVPLGSGKVLALAHGADRLLAVMVAPVASVLMLRTDGGALGAYRPGGEVVLTSVAPLPDGGGVAGGWLGSATDRRMFAARFGADGREAWRYLDPETSRKTRVNAVALDGQDVVLAGTGLRQAGGENYDGLLRRIAQGSGAARAGADASIRRGGSTSLRDVAVAAPGFYYLAGAAWASTITDTGAGSGALTLLVNAAGETLSEHYADIRGQHMAAESLAYRPGKSLIVSGYVSEEDSTATPTIDQYDSGLRSG